MTISKLEELLRTQIPIAKAFGFQIRQASREEVELWMPFEPNKNHMDSAFGGSLYVSMILTCYAWLFNFLQLNEAHGHVVLKSSQAEYLSPVRGDLIVRCVAPPAEKTTSFLKGFQRKEKARITLMAEVHATNLSTPVGARSTHEFVAVR
ncbi:MAG: YiiD C-terminal domain-containing protein [Bdellovibrionales bacterium]